MKKILTLFMCLLIVTGCAGSKDKDQPETSKPTQKEETKKEDTTNEEVYYVELDHDNKLKPGDKLTDISQYLNEFDVSEMESSVTTYTNSDVEIIVDSQQIVQKITLLTDEYELDNDLEVGEDLNTLQKCFDQLTKNGQEYVWNGKNETITFQTADNMIVKITLQK